MNPMTSTPNILWAVTRTRVDYPQAVAAMEARVADIASGKAPETVWLLEHPPLYTAGTSANDADLVDPGRFPVYRTGRGGQFTYHGPGQRVAYVMLDTRRHGGGTPDLRRFVYDLEEWLITALAAFNVKGERREGRIGIWVAGHTSEDKIAAIGIRVRRGISYHGISFNVDPDLSHFTGIVPCGIREHGVTSLVALGRPVTMYDADVALRAAFEEVFAWPTFEGDMKLPLVADMAAS